MSGAALGALGAADLIPGIDAIAIPLTIGLLAVTAVATWHAHHASETTLSDQAPATPCASCADEIPCFNTPEGADPAEMKRQLKEQQDKINEQSPEDMQKRLDEADARKNQTGSYRPEGDSSARAKARDDFRAGREDALRRKYRQLGYDSETAQSRAEAETADKMKSLDATHELDAIAGGAEEDSVTLADKSVNRSIGSQWKSRMRALKDAVTRAKAKGEKKMNVKLDPCEPLS